MRRSLFADLGKLSNNASTSDSKRGIPFRTTQQQSSFVPPGNVSYGKFLQHVKWTHALTRRLDTVF